MRQLKRIYPLLEKGLFSFKKNIFRTNYKNNVLISYITSPFVKIFKYKENKHTNILEAKIIAKIFKEFGFNVDVIHNRSTKKLDYHKYDIIFGFGFPFENSIFCKNSKNSIKIMYATEAHGVQRNIAEIERIKFLKKRKGEILSPKRLLNPYWYASSLLADFIITTGNEFTISTYRKYFDGPIYRVPVSAFIYKDFKSISREYTFAKKNFLWFGSGGLVLKGLDLLLDAFSKEPDLTLHICGPKEDDFFNLYKKELSLPNIKYWGFVNVKSDKFRKIVENCAFVIFPSASEGGGSSLLTAMSTGLVPIATVESSVDMFDFGFSIEQIDIDYIRTIIRNVSRLPEEEIRKRSYLSRKFVLKNHTIDNFEKNFKEILKKILFGVV